MDDNFKSGVFQVPVGEEFIYFYPQSSLVLIKGKLYIPEKYDHIDSGAFIHKAMLAWYCKNEKLPIEFAIYCGHEECKNVCAVVISRIDGRGRGVFNQNHLVDYHRVDYFHGVPWKRHVFARFILNQDQITKRITRIQHTVRLHLLHRKRLHLLAIFLVGQKVLNMDVAGLIATSL